MGGGAPLAGVGEHGYTLRGLHVSWSFNFLKSGGEEEEYEEETIPEEEKEIDLRAEEFIAKFYEQMKLQRQISYLQYNETQKTL